MASQGQKAFAKISENVDVLVLEAEGDVFVAANEKGREAFEKIVDGPVYWRPIPEQMGYLEEMEVVIISPPTGACTIACSLVRALANDCNVALLEKVSSGSKFCACVH